MPQTGARPWRHARAWVLLLVCCTLGAAARAFPWSDSLEDRLNSAWEVLWDERGTPQRVFRWPAGVVRYHVRGPGSEDHREHVAQALASAGEHSGVQFREAVVRPEPAEGPLLDIEFVPGGQLDLQVACATTVLDARDWLHRHVRIQLREQHAWRCLHHEVLHAMGLRGHPSGTTILNYLYGRRDSFTTLDAALLRAWYAPAMRPGFTLLEAWQSLRDRFILDEPAAEQPQAQATAEAVTRELLAGFEALARGDGEVPRIVYRAGRASGEHLRGAVREAAYTLGLAYQRATLVPRDDAAAVAWFRRAADAGHVPAQVLLGRALRDGRGVAQDRSGARDWLGRASRAGNEVARRELAALEATMGSVEPAALRARPLP